MGRPLPIGLFSWPTSSRQNRSKPDSWDLCVRFNLPRAPQMNWAARLRAEFMSEDSPSFVRRRPYSWLETTVGVALQVAASHQPVDFGPDFTQIAEIEVDAGEPDVGHLIDVGQLVQHEIADHFAGDFCAAQALNSILDELDDTLHALTADGPFDRGDTDAGEQLLGVERFAVAVPFGNEQAGRDMLIGSEALLAIHAFTATADRLSSIAGIDYLVFAMSAMGTLHFPSPDPSVWLVIGSAVPSPGSGSDGFSSAPFDSFAGLFFVRRITYILYHITPGGTICSMFFRAC